MCKGVLTDTRQTATRLPSFFVYFILTLNLGATRQKPRNFKELHLYDFYHIIARYQKNVS